MGRLPCDKSDKGACSAKTGPNDCAQELRCGSSRPTANGRISTAIVTSVDSRTSMMASTMSGASTVSLRTRQTYDALNLSAAAMLLIVA